MAEPKAYKGKLKDFKPDQRNLNRHTQRGRGMVEASQRQRGFGRPGFAAKDKTVLGGNLSIMEVAPDIGLGDGDVFVVETDGDIPIIHLRRDIEPGTEKAVLLAAEDNQSALVSIDFDPERLAEEIAQGVDFSGVFTEDEQKSILDGLGVEPPEEPGPPQIDRADELRQEWGTELGQLWALGEHRLIVGDCTDRGVVEKVMGGKLARMIFTDPPYGIGKDFENDNLKSSARVDFYKKWTDVGLSFCIENAYVYVWGYFDTLSDYWQEVIKPRGDCNFRNFVIWEKSFIQGVNAEVFRQYPENYEASLLFIFGQPFQNGPWSTSPNAEYYPEMFEQLRAYLDGERKKMGWDIPTVKKMVGHSDLQRDHWFGKSQWSMPTREVYQILKNQAKGNAFRREYDDLRREYDDLRREYDNTNGFTDLWKFDKLTTTPLHPTVKPIEVCERGVLTSSQIGEIALDLFLGSGSTLIACENLNRRCRGIEIDPGYAAVTLQRFLDHTDIKPELIT